MLSFAQNSITTPNIGLKVPVFGSLEDRLTLGYDLTQLDLLLSGHATVPVTTWSNTATYSTGQVVAYFGKFYASVGNGNVGNLPTNATFWSTTIGSGGSTPSGAANLAYMTPNGTSGSALLRSILPADLPVATGSAFGVVKPDGTTCTVTSGVLTCSGGSGGGGTTAYLNCASDLGAQLNTADTALQPAGGVIMLPNCTTATMSTTATNLPPNISVKGYGKNATIIHCTVAGDCLQTVMNPTTVGEIGAEISSFTINGSGASNQVLMHMNGASGYTMHDVQFEGYASGGAATCLELDNSVSGMFFEDDNFDVSLERTCTIGVLFNQGSGDRSFGYNHFRFHVVSEGSNYALVFNGPGWLYGGDLTVFGNHVGPGGGTIQFNGAFATGNNANLGTLLNVAVEEDGSGAGQIINATGTGILAFGGSIINGGGGANLVATTIGGSNAANVTVSGAFGAQGSTPTPVNSSLVTNIDNESGNGVNPLANLCPNETGGNLCQQAIGHDLGTSDQAVLGFAYSGAGSASNRGVLGMNGSQALQWDPNGNVYIPAGSFTVGSSSYNPNGNIAQFIGNWAYGTTFGISNTSSAMGYALTVEGNGSGVLPGAFYFNNGTETPLTLYANNTTAPLVATLANGAFVWSTATGQPTTTTQKASLSSPSSGVVCADSTTEGNCAAQVKLGSFVLNGIPVTQATTAPTGSCSAIAWVLSNDGQMTFCNGTTYVEKSAGSYTSVTPSITPTAGPAPAQEGYLHLQVPYTKLNAASTTQDIALATVPAGFKLRGLTIVETTPFTGPTGLTAATVSMGRGISDPSSYMAIQPLYQAAGNMRDTGGNYSPVWASHVLTAEFVNTTVTSPANFGNGTTTALTAGLLDVYIWYVVAQ